MKYTTRESYNRQMQRIYPLRNHRHKRTKIQIYKLNHRWQHTHQSVHLRWLSLAQHICFFMNVAMEKEPRAYSKCLTYARKIKHSDMSLVSKLMCQSHLVVKIINIIIVTIPRPIEWTRVLRMKVLCFCNWTSGKGRVPYSLLSVTFLFFSSFFRLNI